MTPLSIEIEGIRSFTTSRAIDFSGLELFAIIGDTGSGKSSILEAMVYALFNGTTWDGKNVKELMSTTASRMRVKFRFQLGERTYTITRITPRVGAASHLLECDDYPDERRDGDRAIAARLKELLGVDREQFIKTVVLPQGEFAALLTLDAGKRATLLADVLGLGIIDHMVKLLSNIRSLANELRAKLIGKRGAYSLDPLGALTAADGLAEQTKRDERALQKALAEIGLEELVLAAVGRRAERRASVTAAIVTVAPEVAAIESLRIIDDGIQGQIDKNNGARTSVKAHLADTSEALSKGKAAGLDASTIAALQQSLERLTGQHSELTREAKELDARKLELDSIESAVTDHSSVAALAASTAEQAQLTETVAKADAKAAVNSLQAAEKAWSALSNARLSTTRAVAAQAQAAAILAEATTDGLGAKQMAEGARFAEAEAKRQVEAAMGALQTAEKAWNGLLVARDSTKRAAESQTRASETIASAIAEASSSEKAAADSRLSEVAAQKEAEAATSALQVAERAWDALSVAKTSSTSAQAAQTRAAESLTASTGEALRAKQSAENARSAEDAAKVEAAVATSALQSAEAAWTALSIASTSSVAAIKTQTLAMAALTATTADALRAKQVNDDAEGTLGLAREMLDAAERSNAAAQAAQDLTSGDACPICGSVLAADFEPPVGGDLDEPRRDFKEADLRRRSSARAHTQTEAQAQFAQEAAQTALAEVERAHAALNEATADAKAAGIGLAEQSDTASLSRTRQRARAAEVQRNGSAEDRLQAEREHSRTDAQLEEAQKRIVESQAQVNRSLIALNEAVAGAISVGFDSTESNAKLISFRQQAEEAESKRSAAAATHVQAAREQSRADAQLEDAQRRLTDARGEVGRAGLALREALADAIAAGIDLTADPNTVVIENRQRASRAQATFEAASVSLVQAEREQSRADAQLETAQSRLAELQTEVQNCQMALDEAMANGRAAAIDLAAESETVLNDIRQSASIAEVRRDGAVKAYFEAATQLSRADAQLEETRRRQADAKAEVTRRVESIADREREINALRSQILTPYLSRADAISEKALADAATALDTASEAAKALTDAHLVALEAERSIVEAARKLNLRRSLEIDRPLAERRRRLISASDSLRVAGYDVPIENDNSDRSVLNAMAWGDAISQVGAAVSVALATEEDDDLGVRATATTKIMGCLGRCDVVSVEALLSKRDEALIAVGAATAAREKLARELVHTAALDKQIAQVEPLALALDALHGHLGDAKFKKFATERKQDKLLGVGTSILRRMTNDRYGFSADLRIVDRSALQARSPETLSGGEKFQASLALALALVEIASRSGRHFGALFLDEGFGSLDPQALDEVLSELERQAETGRMIGVITHVASVIDYIDDVLRVVRTPSGSQVTRMSGDETDRLTLTGSATL